MAFNDILQNELNSIFVYGQLTDKNPKLKESNFEVEMLAKEWSMQLDIGHKQFDMLKIAEKKEQDRQQREDVPSTGNYGRIGTAWYLLPCPELCL